jgi:hypothetical protein
MSADTEPASTTRAGPERAATTLSPFELDLLVLGYLSAVARELDHRGIAECRLRLGPAEPHRLAGALDLEPITDPGRAPDRLQ